MRSYLAHIAINLKLTARDRLVLFFNYAFPLAFFFVFAQSFEARQGGAITQVATMVLILGALGGGFFGAGIRAVQDRELGILRRFKVAPISAAPILVASMVTGWLNYIPAAALIVGLSHLLYGMPFPQRWLSLLVLLSLAIVSFRSVGLIVASVVNSVQESQILIQLLYLPMLFLSGATFPLTMLPVWLQVVAQFLPATYLYTGLQGIMIRNESLAASWQAVAGLAITLLLATLISVKLFRWEKEEKVRASAKLWLAAVLLPFLLLGGWQAYSRENVTKAKILLRDMSRGRTLLIRDARIFVGDGRVVETGAVLIRRGRIERVYAGPAPPAESLNAESIEASGKTVLPGFIDLRVSLAQPGGFPNQPPADPLKAIRRALRAYLYCGVTAVRSVGDPPELLAPAARDIRSGMRLGAEVFTGELSGARMPMLAAAEARRCAEARSAAPLERSLVQQAVPLALIESAKRWLSSRAVAERLEPPGGAIELTRELALGTGSGAPLLPHGPALHRELQLWVAAGVPAAIALQSATFDAARRLNAGGRIGAIAPEYEATLVVVDGNPLQDISATERISLVIFRGERIARSQMLQEE
ncbi:MAG: ABC transporter permease [Acidobacteria bacterium]|nr:ABC transporter permease [Acidobacteriota bacterium]